VSSRLALAAPDKFRGSLRAVEVADALADGARRAEWGCRKLPLADGGEGTLEALGGVNRVSVVSGPLGTPVEAGWRLEDGAAVIEAAGASGLSLAGGASANDPVRASTHGTGELIAAALAAGAESIVVAVGGSATTDGGLGAVEALGWQPLAARVRVACDVRTPFLEAAATFGPQKGATPEQVALLSERLGEIAGRYRKELGIDVTGLRGAGAAGGLAGGLAALGAQLVPGFQLVAGRLDLENALAGADIVLTGEGRLDRTSFAGKIVGELLALCGRQAIPALVVAGEIEDALDCPSPAVSLVARYGRDRAWEDPAGCIADAAAEALGAVTGKRACRLAE
jgi:glycerate 2-kinase